ncbi:MAG: hypothetical protein LBK96_06820, partial [Prevotellaceae bacterium]|nr:hypothetical protein [Prevotellaceae bacterium]
MKKVMVSLTSKAMIFVCLSAMLLPAGCSNKPEPETKEKVIPVKTLHIAASTVAGEMSYVG